MRTIPIPPFLAKVTMDLESPSFFDCSTLFRDTAKQFDSDNKDDATVPESTKTMKAVLSYLWAIGHNRLSHVPFQPSVRPTVVSKPNVLHMPFLHAEQEEQPPKEAVPIEEQSLLKGMTPKLEITIKNNSMGLSTAPASAPKHKFENRFTPIFQTLLLTASATASSSIPTESCASACEYF